MKILVVHCSYNHQGGEDTVVQEEVKLLTENGNETDQLFFSNKGNTLMKILMLPFNCSAYFKTRQKLRQFRPDIIHIHNLHFAATPAVIYAAKRSKIPCVATIHNFRLLCPSASLFYNGKIFTNSLHSKFPWKAIKEKVYRNSAILTFWLSISLKLHQILRTWEKCSRLIVLNENTKKLFLDSPYRFTHQQITVKPNFCTLPSAENAIKKDYFLYVGRLTEEKGIHILLDAFASCSFPIVIAGDGPLKEKVMAYAAKYATISYVGIVKKPELFNLIKSSTALVFPSVWFEGMPLTIIEAFACKTPVIASKIGAMENMIQDGISGLHFESGNRADLIDKLQQWQLLSAKQKDTYSSNAYAAYTQHYTPAKNYDQLSYIYHSVK